MNDPKLEPNQRATGTKRTGYEERGPYHCGDCVHFIPKEHGCAHPEVMADSGVPKLANGHGNVNAKRGCCEFVRPPGDKSDAEKSGMRG